MKETQGKYSKGYRPKGIIVCFSGKTLRRGTFRLLGLYDLSLYRAFALEYVFVRNVCIYLPFFTIMNYSAKQFKWNRYENIRKFVTTLE